MQESSTLRERKKRETRVALALAARRLVYERGLDAVTIEEIAAAADVSTRTFFNYFSGKDEALVGVEPAALQELADALRARPEAEEPLDALRAVLLSDLDRDGETAQRWQLRNELVRRHPSLLPRHLASQIQVEETLAAALAERMGTELDTDPAPRALVASVMAVIRSTIAWWWEHSDRSADLTEVLGRMAVVHLADPCQPDEPTR